MNNEISYARVGDYLLPEIILHDPPPNVNPLGRYGRMRHAFLREHRPILYNQLLLSEKLFPHLWEIDETANERRERGVSEEIILTELVYDDFS